MGHQRLGKLPTSRPWRDVVAALAGAADAGEIAALSAAAAESAFVQARQSPAFVQIVDLLIRLPLAARMPDYVDGLRDLGLDLETAPSFPELMAALAARMDAAGAAVGDAKTSDVPELARLAALDALTGLIEPQLPRLFGADPADVRSALSKFASGQQFAVLAREFYARFIYRTLDYYLSRELAAHTGPGRRFEGFADRRAFEAALAVHCRESTLIIADHSSGWFGKHVYLKGDLSEAVVRSFVAYSLRKVLAELGKRQDA